MSHGGRIQFGGNAVTQRTNTADDAVTLSSSGKHRELGKCGGRWSRHNKGVVSFFTNTLEEQTEKEEERNIARGILKEVGFEDEEIDEELVSFGKFGGDSKIPTSNNVFLNIKPSGLNGVGGGNLPKHKSSFKSPREQEPREALELPQNSTHPNRPVSWDPGAPLTYSPCELPCTDVGGNGREGVDPSPYPCPVPRPLSCAEGDGTCEPELDRCAGARPHPTEGNRLYTSI